jgi:alpha-beta hydrolase superfamily lysophospholipase
VIERDGFLRGAGGRRIFWRSWLPDGGAASLVVLVHGAGEHSGRYLHVAARLVSEGHAVYALDHRGHGRSDGPRALIDRMDNAVQDLDSLVVAAASVHPDAPVFLLGHSLGGLITLRYLLVHQDRVAGAVLSGTLASVDASPALRSLGQALSVVAPRLPLIGVDPALTSRDPSVVADYREDPLVHHGKLPARTCAEIADAADPLADDVGSITVPALIMFGTADGLCDPQGSIMLGDRIGSHDVTVRAYEGLYHEILNEPERETVLSDVTGWVGAHVAAAALA